MKAGFHYFYSKNEEKNWIDSSANSEEEAELDRQTGFIPDLDFLLF